MSWQATQAVLAQTTLLKDADYGGFRILLALADRANKDGVVGVAGKHRQCVGNTLLATEARVHKNTITNWLPRLVERGELLIERGGGGRGSWAMYTLPHVGKHTLENKLTTQEDELTTQGHSTNSNTRPVDNSVDKFETLAQRIDLLTQAVELLTQQNTLTTQENDTNDTSRSHTRGLTIKPNQPTKNHKPPLSQQNEFDDNQNSGGGEIVQALTDFEIWGERAIKIAALPHCTLDYVTRHIAKAEQDRINPQTLAWRLENNRDAPKAERDRNRNYIPEEYKDIILS